MAKARNLTGLSITDHDTTQAYERAIPYAKTLGITLVPGIEISAEHERNSIHVLGYAFDLAHPALLSFTQRLQADREERNQAILARLAALKLVITMEELKEKFPHGTIGRPHIAKMMVNRGFVSNTRQAFDRYLGNKSCCYVGGLQIPVIEAINLIHEINGFAVLAHPYYLKPKRLLTKMLEMPFDGIEGYYGQLSPKQEEPFLAIAKEKGWFVTGGSDFHGEKKSFQNLGCSFTPPEVFARFLHRFIPPIYLK